VERPLAARLAQVGVEATRTRPVMVGHFSVESYHAVAVALALVDRAKLRCLAPPGYQLNTINHPLPRQPETVVVDKVHGLPLRYAALGTGCAHLLSIP